MDVGVGETEVTEVAGLAAPEIVGFVEGLTVVGGDDDEGIVRDAALLEAIHEHSDVVVHVVYLAVVKGRDAFCVGEAVIAWVNVLPIRHEVAPPGGFHDRAKARVAGGAGVVSVVEDVVFLGGSVDGVRVPEVDEEEEFVAADLVEIVECLLEDPFSGSFHAALELFVLLDAFEFPDVVALLGPVAALVVEGGHVHQARHGGVFVTLRLEDLGKEDYAFFRWDFTAVDYDPVAEGMNAGEDGGVAGLRAV